METCLSSPGCGGVTEADVGGLGQRSGGLVGPEAVLLPQLVPLLQRQDDGGPVVPLLLAVPLHIVEQILPLCFMAPHNTCTHTRQKIICNFDLRFSTNILQYISSLKMTVLLCIQMESREINAIVVSEVSTNMVILL